MASIGYNFQTLEVNPSLYIDESERKKFIMTGGLVAPHVRNEIRRLLIKEKLPNQRRLHMNAESNSRRKQIIRTVSNLEFESAVTFIQNQSLDHRGRALCLQSLLTYFHESRFETVYLESHTRPEIDRTVLRNFRHENSAFPIEFHHLAPSFEPLLWLPDIVGWCWGRGGEWRDAITPKIQNVIQLTL